MGGGAVLDRNISLKQATPLVLGTTCARVRNNFLVRWATATTRSLCTSSDTLPSRFRLFEYGCATRTAYCCTALCVLCPIGSFAWSLSKSLRFHTEHGYTIQYNMRNNSAVHSVSILRPIGCFPPSAVATVINLSALVCAEPTTQIRTSKTRDTCTDPLVQTPLRNAGVLYRIR